ncbi:esterase YqiA [Marinomonas spartinae]|uniref:YqiA/YcfP family alpha/beta fold hydrolase n=1 Tax=Marinomonas spartinae TaxID=1792290 RepID=UPI000808ACC4|nr:YqiA/YcfP family alpha/beta fold hydrolase [Marinomonas spartinae]SBS28529.1 esterase YqiA [Marinomonas spartinae]
MNTLLYIHGFNSSELSEKATLLTQAMRQHGVQEAVFLAPRLVWQPAKALAQLEDLITAQHAQGNRVTLIGSSLGGFYGSCLAEKYQIRCILVNPAVQAPTLLVEHLGPQHNPYTDEYYVLTEAHMAELQAMMVVKPTPSLYWLMVQEGDETLDYRAALRTFPETARLTHEPNGNHRFEGFERFTDDILRFANIIV